MAEVVIRIAWLRRNAHEEDDNNVGNKVGKRVYGIGYHGRAASEYTSYKFEHEEQEIDEAAP